MESTESGNNGIKCWCVDGKKETRVKKRTRKGKSENMKKKRGKEDKQGREEGLASQHAVISVFISAEHPDTRGRSPWHTAFTNAVCVCFGNQSQQTRGKVKTQMQTHTVCGFWVLCCEKDDLGNTNHKECQKDQKSHRQDDQP